jgi:hypothetical protein
MENKANGPKRLRINEAAESPGPPSPHGRMTRVRAQSRSRARSSVGQVSTAARSASDRPSGSRVSDRVRSGPSAAGARSADWSRRYSAVSLCASPGSADADHVRVPGAHRAQDRRALADGGDGAERAAEPQRSAEVGDEPVTARPVCTCVGSGRNWRPCLWRFDSLSRAEQVRVMIRLGIHWMRGRAMRGQHLDKRQQLSRGTGQRENAAISCPARVPGQAVPAELASGELSAPRAAPVPARTSRPRGCVGPAASTECQACQPGRQSPRQPSTP